MITEDHHEQLCLDWLRSQGCSYDSEIAHDSDIPERSDYLQVALTRSLLAACQWKPICFLHHQII